MTRFLFRRTRIGAPGAGLALLLGWLLLTACGGSDGPPAQPTPDPTIRLATSATLGNFLTDKAGNTLYYFTRDVDGQNVCTGGCAAVWPIFYEADVQVGNGLQASDFKTQLTAGGQPQTTYKGWPLYYYAPAVNGQNVREASGQTTGNGIGSVWYVVNPGYSVMVATKAVTDKSTSQATTKSFLIDGKGRTLYFFRKDDLNPNTLPTNCTGSCEAAWPPFTTAGRQFPTLLKASDFGTITRTTAGGGGPYGDGTASTAQLTYKGKPLYYYTADNLTRGRVEGHGLVSEGDQWLVATP
ncbi:hypothetical protein [Hymenobacter metallilatus]|uniref:Lipoprotein n=1 Tax=Hymenobacter metallilatus TaxID=2493666 RepID=A0A428JPR8_9BACT|nr:hypothetical protein [Hymenobacter metallilatus]RSK35334.1 hypothetical protein EI290_06445 [Hymenobacter metallilatus]